VLPTSPTENKFLKGDVRIAPPPAQRRCTAAHFTSGWAFWPIPDSARDCLARHRVLLLRHLATLRFGERRERPPTSRGVRLHSRPRPLRSNRLEFHALQAGNVRDCGRPAKVTSAGGVIACAKAGLGIALASRGSTKTRSS
jgi:hypothetical protein